MGIPAVASALRAWLMGRFGGAVDEAGPPSRANGGRDHATYLLHFRGERLPAPWASPLVARITDRPERHALLEREAQLQTWCAEHRFPAPRVLAVLPPGEIGTGPVEVMERLPGTTAAVAVGRGPCDLGRALASLLAHLHTLPVPAWAPPEDPSWSVVERRLSFVRFVVAEQGDPQLGAALEQVGALLPSLAVPDPVVCHGDFHPYNVMVDGDRFGLIDWTDSGIGDRHADLSRSVYLLETAAHAAAPGDGEAIAALARSFLAGYRENFPVDPVRLRRWRPLQVLHEWATLEAEAALPGAHAPIPPDRLRGLRNGFGAAMAQAG